MVFFIYRFIIFILFSVCFYSCSVSSLSLDVVRPAEIDVPNHIQDIIIINRSLPSKGNQVQNVLDGILSGEGIGDDKKGSLNCVNGVFNILNIKDDNVSRFNLVNADGFTNGDYFKGTGTSEFPTPIKWKKINKVFQDYNVDALVVLETFDSQSSILNGGTVERIKFINKKKTKVTLIEAILNIEVQAGWRIYDVKNEKIIDEKKFLDQKSFTSTGSTFEYAKQNLPKKKDAICQTGEFAGQQYAFRISPKKDRVKRNFYIHASKSSKDANVAFKNASRSLRDRNFDKAAAIWQNFVQNENEEIAGRACFNMALASELKNNYNLAIEWIKKSIYYNNKKAENYFIILKNRKTEIKRVEKQLKK
ncbi:MAG: hypothetical protein CMP49_02640 [Flavobacteriales bacterium]|nr:hypothetical protein [Flavobacteriales bacterium]|tara:strand:+ start:8493 stop:9581 length:1089 start_codon:yes stop_codon:yes gene_type:complete